VQDGVTHDEPGTGLATVSDGRDGVEDETYDSAYLRSGLWWEGIRRGGVLLLHDFGRTPEGLAHLALSSYDEGFWTAAPLLAGHDSIEAGGRLRSPSLADMLSAVDRWATALQAATTPIVVVGCGVGAALAVLVANTYAVHGLVTVNLPLRSYRRRRLRARLTSMAIGRARGLVADTKDPESGEISAGFLSYDAFKLACDLERLAAAELASVQVPTLMFQSREDHVVDPGDAAEALDRLGTAAKELIWLERSFHDAWIDYDGRMIADRVGAFVRALADRPALPPPPVEHSTGEHAAYQTGEMIPQPPPGHGWAATTPAAPDLTGWSS